MPEENGGLFAELKRRRVLRVAGVYVVVALGVVEAADILLPRLEVPDWTVTFIAVLAILGFPLTVALAWAFDITPDGVRRAQDSDRTASPVIQWTAGKIAVVGAVAVLAVAGGGWFLGRDGPPPAVDPQAVAVLPFRVSGAEPSLAYLREGVVDLLAAKLTGEAGPRAVNPRTLLSAWRRTGGSESEDLAPEDGAALARRLGAGKVLMGDVVGSAGSLTIRAELLDVATGARTEAQQTGSAEELPALVDRVAATLLALEAGEDRRRLEQLTTTSLPALRAYLQGQVEYRHARFSEAADYFERAVSEDSTFALAAMGLSAALGWYAQRPGRAEAYRLAWAHRDRLSGRDRRLLTALVGPAYPRPSSRADELRAYQRALDASADDPELWYRVGDVYYHTGARLGYDDHLERSLTHFSRALELDPDFGPAAEHLFVLHVRRDAVDEALASGRRYLGIGGEGADAVRWLMAQLGDTAVAAPALADLDPAGAERVLLWTLDGGFLVDSADAAFQVLEERLRDDGTPFQVQNARVLGAGLALRHGRPSAALPILEEMGLEALLLSPLVAPVVGDRVERDVRALFERPEDERPEEILLPHLMLALREIRRGEPDRARSLLAELEADILPDGESQPAARIARLLLDAELAVHDGRDDAAARVDALDRATLEVPPASFFVETASAALVGLHEALGDPEAALAATRRRAFTLGTAVFLPELYRERGRLAALVGRRDEAVRAYRTYLDFRVDPEPAIAEEVARVRDELERLVRDSG